MAPVTIRVQLVDPSQTVLIPRYAQPNDAGMDLKAARDTVVCPHTVMLIPTGIRVEVPPGFEMQVRSRSGLAIKQCVFVLNSPGTIDSGYRGEVGVIIYNLGTSDYVIKYGDRIAQAVICELPKVCLEVVTALSETQRGIGGFGSTGK